MDNANKTKLNENLGGTQEIKLKVIEGEDPGVIKNIKPIISAAKQIEFNSKDIVIPRKDIVINTLPFDINMMNVPKNEVYPMTNWSFGQVCEAVGVPVKYIKKCLENEKEELAYENLNTWWNKIPENKDFLLRLTNDRLYGFLSSRYGILDDVEVLNLLTDTVSQHGDYIVKESHVSPDFMNLRIVQKDLIPIDGEDLSVGINVRNSRVGKSRLDLRLMVFKWICKNGVIFGGGMGTLFEQRHFGLNPAKIKGVLIKNLNAIPDIVQNIKKWVEASKGNKLNSDSIQKIINDMKKDILVSKQLETKIIELVPKYGNNVFGMTQAITEASQDYSIDLRESLELYAGRLLAAA